MKKQDHSIVKILLTSGTGIHMYADPGVIDSLKKDYKFLRFSDDFNDNIYLSMEHVAGFEVLDDRKDTAPIQDAEVPSPVR